VIVLQLGWPVLPEIRRAGPMSRADPPARHGVSPLAPSAQRTQLSLGYAAALHGGRDTALSRMVVEAAALGADGVVGVRITDVRQKGGRRDIVALGTAVRSRGRQRPGRPFTTDLGGQGLATLLAAGWVPVSIAFGVSAARFWGDWRTRLEVGVFGGNVEATGYTRLVGAVRAGARDDFAACAARAGGDGALLTSISHRVSEWEDDRGRGRTAECVVTGNAVASFDARATASVTAPTILPLRDPPGRTR
jgi:uncharacterized protein YbjQ (UPF0145 family)